MLLNQEQQLVRDTMRAFAQEQLAPSSAVTATFAKYEAAFQGCLAGARQGEGGASLNGQTVTVTMTVNPNGKALYPTLDDVALNGTELGKCLKRESGKIQFPPFGGDPIRVRKPIVLK